MSFLFTSTLTLCLATGSPDAEKTHEPHPLAPSLPKLSAKEEKALDQVIERFIQYEIGKVRPGEGARIIEDFHKLGPEATFALIRGLNRAANIEGSCPVVVIGKKLGKILRSTEDVELLQYARESIGLGVTVKRHQSILTDLKFACVLRKGELARKGIVKQAPAHKAMSKLSVAELNKAIETEHGPQVPPLLKELAQRKGDKVIDALSTAAAQHDSGVQKLARELLTKNLTRLSPSQVKARLKDENTEVRAAAARASISKGLRLGGELIDLLEDADENVRQSARQGLVQLSKGADYGPAPEADAAARAQAVKQWRAWWASQSK
jgi:hypothetical protein